MTDTTDLRRWCEEANQTPAAKANGWWYYPTRDEKTGHLHVQKLEGGLGEEVQRYAAGWRPDFQNWPADRLAAHARKLQWFVKQATSPTQESLI